MSFNFFSTVAAVWPCWCCTVADYRAHAMKNTTRNNSIDYSPTTPRLSCSSVPSVKIWEARVNYPDTVFIRLLSKETPQPVEPIRAFFFFFFFLHKMAAVLSAAWQSSGCLWARRGRGSLRSLLVPAPHTGELVRAVLGWRSWLVSVTGGQPCGLNSKGSCHRNAQVSPQACVAHLTQWMGVSYHLPPPSHSISHPYSPQGATDYARIIFFLYTKIWVHVWFQSGATSDAMYLVYRIFTSWSVADICGAPSVRSVFIIVWISATFFFFLFFFNLKPKLHHQPRFWSILPSQGWAIKLRMNPFFCMFFIHGLVPPCVKRCCFRMERPSIPPWKRLIYDHSLRPGQVTLLLPINLPPSLLPLRLLSRLA